MSKLTRKHQLLTFDECAFVLSHPERFSVEHALYPGAEEIRGRRGVQLIAGEPHSKVHAFLGRYFSSNLEGLRTSILRPCIAAAMKTCAQKRDIEVFQEVAAPLSLRIIARTLGLPDEDTEFMTAFAEWRDSMTPWVATEGESFIERHAAIVASNRLRDATMPTIRARKLQPCGDLLSTLWSIGPSIFSDWSEDDVLDQCRIMLLAGSEGVARLTSTTIHLAFDAFGLRQQIASGNLQVASVLVNHACQLYPPAQLRPRVAKVSMKLGERRVAAGDRMCVDVVAANRDPARRPTSDLTFSIGDRYCSGAPLACAEAEEILSAFFRAFPGCVRLVGAPPPEFQGLLFLGFSPVHVRLHSEAAAA